MIIPIIKKREGKVDKDYREITLMATKYKVYMAVLAERIRIMKEKRQFRTIREELVRVEKVLRETRSRVRARGDTGKSFLIARESKQCCPLNLTPFSVC